MLDTDVKVKTLMNYEQSSESCLSVLWWELNTIAVKDKTDCKAFYGHILTVTHLQRECQHVSSDTFYCCASCASFWRYSRCCCSGFCGS